MTDQLRKVAKRKTAVHVDEPKTKDPLENVVLDDPAANAEGDELALDNLAHSEAPPRRFVQKKGITINEIFEIYNMLFMSLLNVPVHVKGSMANIQMREDYARMLSDGAMRHFPEMDENEVKQDNG